MGNETSGLRYEYDPVTDTATIEGVRYAGDLFRSFAVAPVGTVLEIVGRADEVVTLRRHECLVAAVERLDPKPGDVFKIELRESVPPHVLARIRKEWEERLAGTKAIVLDGTVTATKVASAEPPKPRPVLLIVKREADAAKLFPGGVPPYVEVRSAYRGPAPLDGLTASVVLLGPGLDDATLAHGQQIAAKAGGVCARVGGESFRGLPVCFEREGMTPWVCHPANRRHLAALYMASTGTEAKVGDGHSRDSDTSTT